MASADHSSQPSHDTSSTPTWTYPTRFCRICREDVSPTVTMYPPGLPPSLQKPIIEYVNEDEYGRLIKPCMCRGGMRYIHELCLLRSRTENTRVGSMWKCHECGYQFNFQRLALQRWLSSKYASGVLTVVVMLIIMFVLGFIADPILNLYADPYETLLGREAVWNEVKINAALGERSSWFQHFFKGLVSMGLVGFLKVYILNPLHWWGMRPVYTASSRGTSSTGRDRAANISLVAVAIGVTSAFYFFYKWVQAIIQKSLQRIGNNIVNTQLSDDDDDLKPPPERKPEGLDKKQTTTSESKMNTEAVVEEGSTTYRNDLKDTTSTTHNQVDSGVIDGDMLWQRREKPDELLSSAAPPSDHIDSAKPGRSAAVKDAISEGWSFAELDGNTV